MIPRVIAIILNYKRPNDTIACIDSVRESDYPSLDILVVDNNSGDGSVERIVRACPGIEVLECKDNLGYAGGNNAGIRTVFSRGHQYFFILNNDAFVEKSTVRLLVEEGERDVRATILAPKVCDCSSEPKIASVGTSMDWLRLRPRSQWYGKPADGVSGAAFEAEILPGSALLIKRCILSGEDLFNEGYFLIHEDADLCYRNRSRGFLNKVVPASVVFHQESKTLSAYPFLTEYYSTRNFLYLAMKRAGMFDRLLCAAGFGAQSIRFLAEWPVSSGARREKVNGFFAGAKDFIIGRRGRYGASS